MLGFLRGVATEITNVKIRCTLYLSKFISKLPFVCGETYNDRLISLLLLRLTTNHLYWHEYLDITFFFKAINNNITFGILAQCSAN